MEAKECTSSWLDAQFIKAPSNNFKVPHDSAQTMTHSHWLYATTSTTFANNMLQMRHKSERNVHMRVRERKHEPTGKMTANRKISHMCLKNQMRQSN